MLSKYLINNIYIFLEKLLIKNKIHNIILREGKKEMKAKIFGILVCIMLMTAFLTTAQDVKNLPVEQKSDENIPISFNQVEAPIWEEGYSWTYKIYRFNIDFIDQDIRLYTDLKIDNLYLEVIKVTEDSYELEFEGKTIGSFWIAFDLGDGPINISVELISTTIAGTMLLNKTDLRIKQIHPKIYGTIDVKIEEQPYINFPFNLHKEIIGTIDLEIVMENPYPPIIKFPFEIGEYWGLPATNFTFDGIIESPLLDSIDGFNRIINPILKIINDTISGPKISMLLEFSNILLDILPIINISYILSEYLGMINVVEIPAVPQIICCLGKDIVTVPAGTFECYNISLGGTNIANIYYNDTEVKNIVKVIGNFQDVIPSIGNILAELIAYNT